MISARTVLPQVVGVVSCSSKINIVLSRYISIFPALQFSALLTLSLRAATCVQSRRSDQSLNQVNHVERVPPDQAFSHFVDNASPTLVLLRKVT